MPKIQAPQQTYTSTRSTARTVEQFEIDEPPSSLREPDVFPLTDTSSDGKKQHSLSKCSDGRDECVQGGTMPDENWLIIVKFEENDDRQERQ